MLAWTLLTSVPLVGSHIARTQDRFPRHPHPPPVDASPQRETPAYFPCLLPMSLSPLRRAAAALAAVIWVTASAPLAWSGGDGAAAAAAAEEGALPCTSLLGRHSPMIVPISGRLSLSLSRPHPLCVVPPPCGARRRTAARCPESAAAAAAACRRGPKKKPRRRRRRRRYVCVCVCVPPSGLEAETPLPSHSHPSVRRRLRQELAPGATGSGSSSSSSSSQAAARRLEQYRSFALDFEGVGDNVAVGAYYASSFGITFGSAGTALVAVAAGGSGPFANPPSNSTALAITNGTIRMRIRDGLTDMAFSYTSDADVRRYVKARALRAAFKTGLWLGWSLLNRRRC
jgi:hypothetical protein